MEENNNQPSVNKIEYGHSKVLDFVIGFFGVYVIGFLINSLQYAIISNSNIFSRISLFPNFSFAWLAVLVGLIILFYKIKRKYIAIGMMWAAAFPIIIMLLFLGVCFLSVGNYR